MPGSPAAAPDSDWNAATGAPTISRSAAPGVDAAAAAARCFSSLEDTSCRAAVGHIIALVVGLVLMLFGLWARSRAVPTLLVTRQLTGQSPDLPGFWLHVLREYALGPPASGRPDRPRRRAGLDIRAAVVRAASRLALSGLVLLMLSLVSAVLLIMDVVFGTGHAVVMAAGTLGWFFTWWFALPVYSRIRHAAAGDSSRPGDGQEPGTGMSSPRRIP